MVLIEPNTEFQIDQQTQTIETREPVRQSEGQDIILKKKVTFKTEKAFQDFIHGTKKIYGNIKEALGNVIQGVDFRSLSQTPQQKANIYVKKCWLHMSRNEVERAREAYEGLREAYEQMREGPQKTELYHEVYDIYTRLSEVHA